MKIASVALCSVLLSFVLARLAWLETKRLEPEASKSAVVTFEDLARSPADYNGKRITITCLVVGDSYMNIKLYKRLKDAFATATDGAGWRVNVGDKRLQFAPTPSAIPSWADVTGVFFAEEKAIADVSSFLGHIERIEELKIHLLTDEQLISHNFEVR